MCSWQFWRDDNRPQLRQMAPSYITAFFGVERRRKGKRTIGRANTNSKSWLLPKREIDSETRETGGKKSCKSLQDISDQTACFFCLTVGRQSAAAAAAADQRNNKITPSKKSNLLLNVCAHWQQSALIGKKGRSQMGPTRCSTSHQLSTTSQLNRFALFSAVGK